MSHFNRRSVFIAACAGILIFGIVMAALGALLPAVIPKYGLDNSAVGTLIFFMTFGMLIGSVFFGPVVDRYGYKWLLTVCTAMVMAGFWGIAYAPGVAILQFSLFLIGCGGGVLNGGTNALVADISEGSRGSGLSFLGFFFGIGAFGIPFVLGTMLDTFGYERIIATVGTLFLLPIFFFIFLRFPTPKQAQGFPLREALGLVREGPLLLFGITLFLQSGLEMSVGGWTATFLDEKLGLGAQRAALLLSAYWLGLMIARLVTGFLTRYIAVTRVMQVSVILSLIGVTTILLAESQAASLFGLLLMGAGFSAVFPLTLGCVGDAYPHLSGTAFSLVLTMSLFGGMLFPWIIGLLADSFSLGQALWLIPVMLILLIVTFRIAEAKARTVSTAGAVGANS